MILIFNSCPCPNSINTNLQQSDRLIDRQCAITINMLRSCDTFNTRDLRWIPMLAHIELGAVSVVCNNKNNNNNDTYQNITSSALQTVIAAITLTNWNSIRIHKIANAWTLLVVDDDVKNKSSPLYIIWRLFVALLNNTYYYVLELTMYMRN